jgi:Tfp pilus assembly protein PilO
MRSGRRKVWVRLLEIAALVLVVANVAAYFAVLRPVEKMRAAEETRFKGTRDRIQELRGRVAQLERYQAAIPATAEELEAFLKAHVPLRRQGFSRAARLVRRHTDEAGVQLTGINYKLETLPGEPLRRLNLEIDVAGPLPALLDFAHSMETANDLVVLRNFTLEAREGRDLGLRLGAELYLQP